MTSIASYTPGNAVCSMHYRPGPVLIVKQMDPVTHSFILAFVFNSGLNLWLYLANSIVLAFRPAVLRTLTLASRAEGYKILKPFITQFYPATLLSFK